MLSLKLSNLNQHSHRYMPKVASALSNRTGHDSARVGIFRILLLFQNHKPTKQLEPIPEATVAHRKSEWKAMLSPLAYSVCRKGRAESPHTGIYVNTMEKGFYMCKCCDTQLFSSEDKFLHYSGYPCFSTFAFPRNVFLRYDHFGSLPRKEVLCKVCHARLGYEFRDGPPPYGKRYCIYSVALSFYPLEASTQKSSRF